MMTMLLIHIGMLVTALGFVGFLYFLGRQQKQALREDRKESHEWWFQTRRKERDDLLETAKLVHSQGGFRAQREDESSWDYAEAFDYWSSRQLNMDPTTRWSSPVEFERRRPMPHVKGFGLGAIMQKAFDDGFKAVRQAFDSLPPAKVTTDWSMTVRTYWWSAELDGVVHKGAKLRIQPGDTEAWITRCDVDRHVEPEQVKEHLEGSGPLVTCLWCSTGIRRK